MSHKSRQTIIPSPAEQIARRLEIREEFRITGKARVNRRYFTSKLFYRMDIEAELFEGDKPTGIIKVMNGWDYSEENRKFEDEFYRSLDVDGNSKTRMKRWKAVDKEFFNKLRAEVERRFF